MRFVLAALIGLLLPCAALAGDAADTNARLASRVKDPELRDMTERLLREMNTDYSGLADTGLQLKGEKFDHARLEITGVLSNDPTEAIEPGLFDQFVKPSFSNPEKLGFIDGVIDVIRHTANPTRNLGFDVKDYRQAAAGVMTERAMKVLAAYKNKEINEIVAHSWGCELIYAAILNGAMRPPKKLIVVGVPDDDFAKWEELALRTGTAVVWVRAKNDKVASNGADLVKGTGGDVKAAWDKACAGSTPRVICPPHKRAPSVAAKVVLAKIPGVVGHDRKEYYDALKDMHILQGGFLELRAVEKKVKDAEVIKVERATFDAALTQARHLVKQAREQAYMAQRDHDERLRNTYLDLAQRSCANPGSVTQAELDGIPKPYGNDFKGTLPQGPDCSSFVYASLCNGGDAEEIRRLSSPTPMPVSAQPLPDPAVATPLNIRTPFSTVLPGLRNHAVNACNSSGEVPIDSNLTNPSNPFSFWKEMDDKAANKLAAGLGNCEGRLFRELIRVIREGYGNRISSGWVKETVAEYRPRPNPPSGNTSRPPREDAGGTGERCFTENGIRGCRAD
jgi:hypothetical protein